MHILYFHGHHLQAPLLPQNIPAETYADLLVSQPRSQPVTSSQYRWSLSALARSSLSCLKLSTHIASIHGDGESYMPCDQCETVFPPNADFNLHYSDGLGTIRVENLNSFPTINHESTYSGFSRSSATIVMNPSWAMIFCWNTLWAHMASLLHTNQKVLPSPLLVDQGFYHQDFTND